MTTRTFALVMVALTLGSLGNILFEAALRGFGPILPMVSGQ